MNLEVGQDGLPTSGSGSIVINDQWESLGENRRVFDYFDRYTPINQTVTVYRAIETIGDTDMPSSWTVIYTGKVESYSKDKESLTFSVSNSLVESKIITKTITADMAPSGYTVPDQSIGKSLPIVFGSSAQNCPAYPIKWKATDVASGRYAYVTNLGSQFTHSTSLSQVYAMDRDGVYRSVSSTGNSLYGPATASGANYATSHGLTEFIVPITPSPGSDNVAVIKAKWWCKGQNAVITPVGKITATLYRCAGTSVTAYMRAWEELQSVDIDKSTYQTEVRGVSDFNVTFEFEVPEIWGEAGGDYYLTAQDYVYGIGIQLSTYSGSSTTDFTSGGSNAASGTYFYRSSENFAEGTGAVPFIEIVSATKSALTASSDIDVNGLSYNYIDFSGGSNLAELDIVIGSYGIRNASAIIDFPHKALEILSYSWNGSTWADASIFDITTYSTLYASIFDSLTHPYIRYLSGMTEGDTTWQDLVNSIVKDTSCFLVPMTNGKLALWPWGNVGSVVRVFTDADMIEVGSFDETDPSTVINNIKIEYGKNFLNINDQWEQSGKPENVTGVIVKNKSSGAPYAEYLTNSEALYGKRELEDRGSQFIGESISATVRAVYFATRHEHTHRTFPVTIPYFDNTDLKLMDVVDICSVHGPSYFGSSSKARLPTYTGIENDIYKGEYPREATRRRCQIIGLSNDYDGDFPKLVMKVREIKPRHKSDPTADSF